MKVSVIVATYRRDEALKNALESVYNQTYSDIEIILVDDNADKEWNEKVGAIASAFNGIIYIKNEENLGSARTRNVAIQAATGDYITFLDDDDVYLPKKIEHQLKDMVETDADFGITDLLLYNEKGNLVDKRIRDYIKDFSPEALIKYHLLYHMTGTDTMMFKREYLLKIGGFEPINIGDEFYLMQKAIEAKGKFCYSNVCDIKAFVHEKTAGLSSGQVKVDGEKVLFEFTKKYFSVLDKKSIRYIKARHHAVVAYAYLRGRKIAQFVLSAMKSFFASPIDCVKILIRR